MTADVRFEIRDREVLAGLERLRLGLPLSGDMSPAMRSMARVLKGAAQRAFRNQRPPDSNQQWAPSRRAQEQGGQTLSDTRRLRNSITSAYDRYTAAVGTNVIYGAIHHFGGVIRAKKGPFLAIPVTPAARAAGGPTKMAGLHVWQTLKGQYVMGDDKGTVHFLLRASVTMPARPFLGVGDDDRAELLRVLREHLRSAWR